MNLSNGGLIAFHYRAYGTFFYNKIGSIIPMVVLPTTEIIELESLTFWGQYTFGGVLFVSHFRSETDLKPHNQNEFD